VQIDIARLEKFSDTLTAENKNVFSFAAKVQTEQFNIRSSGGRLFHIRGPATAKFLASTAVRVRGTCRVLVLADCSGRRPATEDTMHCSHTMQQGLCNGMATIRLSICLSHLMTAAAQCSKLLLRAWWAGDTNC